jgi:hypothetical protein
MDSDNLEGLPTTEELSAELTTDTARPEVVTSAPPAPPVDAASIEPAPRMDAGSVPEQRAVARASGNDEQPDSPDLSKAENSIPEEKVIAADSNAKEEPIKTVTTPSGLSHIPDGPRVDVSAATVARMMGIASTNDLRLLEGRVDLLTSKVSAILTKMDRCLSMFGSVPTASDIGRLEVQVAAIKSMMRELLDSVGAPMSSGKEQADRTAAQEQSRKLREGIKTNTES